MSPARRLLAHGAAQVRHAGVATGLAALLVGGAVASAPVLLDRAAGDLITSEVAHVGLDQRPALSLATSLSGFRANPDWVAEASAALEGALDGVVSLSRPEVTVVGEEVTVAAGPPGDAGPVTLTAAVVGRQRAGANLDLLTGDADMPGAVWLAEQHASELGVTSGDRLEVLSGPSPIDVPVGGVHADVLADATEATRSYWQPISSVLRPARPVIGGDPGQAASQRPALLTEPATALALTRSVLGDAVVRWEATLAPGGLSLGEAERLRADIEQLQEALVVGDGALARAFGRMGAPPVVSSPVLAAVDRAVDSLALASTGVRTLQLAGALLGLGVLGALVAFRVRGQEAQIRRAAAMGLSLPGIAWSLVWALLPVLVGGIALGAVATALVTGASAEGVREAALHCAVAAAFAAAASWAAGLAGVRRAQGAPDRGRARALAWDVPLLALAVAAGYQLLLRGSALVEGPDSQLRLDLLVLAFPVLALGAAAGLLTRLARRVLPRLRGAGAQLPVPALLALRRIGHPRSSALVLLAFATATIGLSSYGGALATSAAAAERDKARTRLGSDVVVALPRDAQLLTVPDTATVVGRATGRLAPRTEQVDIMAVDPDTFLAAAAWHDEFAPAGGATLLSRLREPAVDGVPAVLVGAPDDGPVSFLWRGADVRLRPVGTAGDLPGRSGTAPVVVTSVHRLEEALAQRHPDERLERLLDTELWLADDAEALAGVLPPALRGTLDVRTLADIRADPALQALGWTLDYLQAVGALAVLLALAAAVGRSVTLRREQATAVVMGDRLGLGARAHAQAAAIELAAVLGVAVASGWLVGTGVAAIVAPLLDPLPALPPAPTLHVAPATLAVVAAACLLATGLGAVTARWHARRLSPTAHLRAGT